MNANKFFFSLAILCVITFLGVFFIQGSNNDLSKHLILSYLGITGFAIHNIIFFYVAQIYSSKSMDRKYIGMVYMSVLTKLIFAISLPVAYYLLNSQPQGFFVMPFIIIYIVFTVFETYVLNKMAVMR